MTETAALFIDCRLDLGEGPLWHPGRNELFFFDINAGELLRANAAGDILSRTRFGEAAAACAVVDDGTLLVASASAIVDFDIDSGTFSHRLPLEADNPVTRSNDSRVSPHGGWWVGTMGHNAEPDAGAVYHYRDGALSLIRSGVTIPNATCFSPDGRLAYFADTVKHRIERIALDPETGLPIGEWQVFVDLTDRSASPDGAVCDAEGYLWNAEYGAGRVVRYAPDGSVDKIVAVPCPNVTCPAFGGPDLKTLFITTASQGMSPQARARHPHAGSVFSLRVDVPGLPETPVRL